MAEEEAGPQGPDEELESLLTAVKASRGVDLTGYKRSTLRRRVLRRMGLVGMDGDFARYRDCVRDQPEELSALLDSIFINVTAFFRDRESWDHLAAEVLPGIAAQRPGDAIRVWSAGCASGQEPFSIAMLLAELLGIEEYVKRVKIYGTDWDEGALQQARRARYPRDLDGVPELLRLKYFDFDGSEAVLQGSLRRSVIFGQHDLVTDAPISRVDLLLCRNTLMYFNSEAQGQILDRLHFALADDGVLFLGRAEMLLSHGYSFAPIDLKHRLFGKVKSGRRSELRPAAPHVPKRREEELTRANRLREAALEASPVAQIVLDPRHRLAVLNHQATVMFGIGPPDLGRPLQDLELSYRPIDLRSMLDEAVLERRTVEKKTVELRRHGRDVEYLDISVTPAFRDGAVVAITLTFTDVSHHQQLQEKLQRSSENLETAYEELQSANEELETTNEELQSANEELETTNEELQAASEEMETVNEELRLTNEELQVTNDRLRHQEVDVAHSNVFLNAILSTLRIAMAVVGPDLRVQVWNQLAEDLWGLRADEVIGHPLAELDIGLPVAALIAPIRELQAESGVETRDLRLDAINRRGRTLSCRVLLTPLPPNAATGRGVCILMEDATGSPGQS